MTQIQLKPCTLEEIQSMAQGNGALSEIARTTLEELAKLEGETHEMK